MAEYEVYAIPAAGFRRAGRFFESSTPTRINSEEIGKDAMDKILNEKMLRVVPVGLGKGQNCPGCGVAKLVGGLGLKTLRAVAADKGVEGVGKMDEPALVSSICEAAGEPVEKPKGVGDNAEVPQ